MHFFGGDPPLYKCYCHCFVATTAVTRSMRVEKGQKAPSSSGRTADSDASDNGEESSSASKFLQIVLENSCTTFTLCVIVL